MPKLRRFVRSDRSKKSPFQNIRRTTCAQTDRNTGSSALIFSRTSSLSGSKRKTGRPTSPNLPKATSKNSNPAPSLAISTWGVPIPLEGTEGKVFYVWFDAPIGYISAAKEWAEKIGDKNAWKKYWCEQSTKLIHFIGKDNIPFHAIFFPAMTMGQNLPLKTVDELPANEFLNLEGKQFSKSDNWTIDLERFFIEFTPDQIRYYLAANAPETQDSEFTWKDFQNKCNADLVGKWGNLANRTLVFTQKHANSQIPPPTLQKEDQAFLDKIKGLVDQIKQAYSSFHLRKASQHIMELATAGNVYFDAKKAVGSCER